MDVHKKPFYAFLPDRFKKTVFSLSDDDFRTVTEVRMRNGHPFELTSGGKRLVMNLDPGTCIVTAQDIVLTLEKAASGSMYAMQGAIKRGFLTAPGGHRIGLCGTAVMRDGEIINIRDFSSLCIRVAREVQGASGELHQKLFKNGRFINTVILSPPMYGKTTVLRDLVRIFSTELGRAVALCDERSEVAAMCGSAAQLDVGACDVLEGCEKASGIMMLMRSMSPEIIAVDEITEAADIEAIINANNCGIGLLATAHADGLQDFAHRCLYKELSLQRIFGRYVVLTLREGRYGAEVYDEGGNRL